MFDLTVARNWWRTNRRLVVGSAVLTTLIAVMAMVRAFSLSCDSGMSKAQCGHTLSSDGLSSLLSLALAIVPVFLGVALGVDAVGGELDNRTASFAWSIAARRERWLWERVFPGIVTTAVFGLTCGIVNAFVVVRLNPGHDILASYVGYGLWGPILVVRGLCGYGLGLCIGAILGRIVTSVVVSVLFATTLLIAALIAGRSFEPATIIPMTDPSYTDAMSVQVGVLKPDGTIGSESDCYRSVPSLLNGAAKDRWALAHCSEIQSFISGSLMLDEELRESAILLATLLFCGGITAGIVTDRRP